MQLVNDYPSSLRGDREQIWDCVLSDIDTGSCYPTLRGHQNIQIEFDKSVAFRPTIPHLSRFTCRMFMSPSMGTWR